jgi:glutamyl-tRNA synthetase
VRLSGPSAFDPKAEALKAKMGDGFAANLRRAVAALDPLPESEWRPEPLLETLKSAAEAAGVKLGDAMQPIRVALTGSTVSEPVNELLAIVGRSASLDRMKAAAER